MTLKVVNHFFSSAWHTASWQYTTIPSLVKNGWMVQEILSRQSRTRRQKDRWPDRRIHWWVDKVIPIYASSPQNWGGGVISYLVGALNPVNHKGLNESWTQTSHYLKVINFTSHLTISHVFWAYNIPQALNMGTCIQQGDLFYSVGVHRNWC